MLKPRRFTYTPFTWSKNYLDRDLDSNLDYNLDRDPKVVPVYTGHSLFNTTKGITLLFIVQTLLPCRVGSVGSVSVSHMVGREFAFRPGHTKDHHKNGTNCLPA